MKPSTTARKSARARQPIKHTKTFSGCWTCRERHVKCDEGRPECTRCLKGGFGCQGYGIKLVWVDPDTQEREQNIRRVIGQPAVYDDDSGFMQVDVHEALESIERLSKEGESLSSGPFSVFAMEISTENGLDALDTLQPFCQPIQEGACSDLATNLRAEDEDEEVEAVISPSITPPPSTPSSENDTHFSGCSTLVPFITTLDQPQNGLQPLILRHLDLLPRPAEQRELINHWTSFVCRHLVPVDRPDNPFRSVFTPMALAGLTSPSNQSNGKIALFHALCATSAFSRGQLLNGDARILTLAMKHYHLAIMHLRHSLANLKDNLEVDVQRGSILATITMFSAMDMITGRPSEWRTHLQGGASWLATIEGNVWDRDKSSSMVYQGYLAIAALCNINLPSTVDVESEDFLNEKHYVLDRFFGLTRPILKHIVMMNSLIKCISTTDPSVSPEILDELEMQLYMQTPDDLDLEGLEPLAQALTRHHAYVFYYASLIYFQRTLRRRPPDEMQEMVKLAVAHLEDIEDLGGDMIGCTLVWPPFVVACECQSTDLQERMLSWYMLKRRHGFMNLEISKDIAKELWRRRSLVTTEVDIQWQDVLKDLKMDIVLA
ncbi:uncharacterized protein Z518_02371 [Rhinocladiella mackenziei CBS 650.93]|uniref:Rhinocladiella mackenziei CBS 650.93 unplaced genomic scaffold supercont1.2, whole genome shotgun sequence n=1 Tax=Rhinocladiella mackenziei CBS 650.93 TaxID=1442369 RepID=A0A0D2FZI8_9EURO|nr:uncharacterized protein Z518_02371 [Rhinocladiella mackenziei CBS 650.93]KIX07717.1 hypothetical protein Z518_02371 [Rhinocladiella mackenziei CBS 650.93]